MASLRGIGKKVKSYVAKSPVVQTNKNLLAQAKEGLTKGPGKVISAYKASKKVRAQKRTK